MEIVGLILGIAVIALGIWIGTVWSGLICGILGLIIIVAGLMRGAGG